MTGSGSPGSQTSSMRLARPQTATSTTPSSSSDRLAAATRGRPPATTRGVGGTAKRRGGAAVDGEEVGRMGERARAALLGGDALLVPTVGLLLEVPGEAAPDDLG